MKTFITAITLSLSILTIPATFAGEVAGLNSFTAGTPARAANVNDNFTAVKTAVDDNHARIITLEAANAALLSDNTTLNARLAALEAKLASVSLQTVNGQPTVRFEGVNVQIVNGLNATDSVNGTGNLLVGYDEMRTAGTSVCSLGTDANGLPITDVTACTTAGGTFALNHKTGSHNLIVGSLHSYSRAAGVVFGFNNTVNGEYASVSGGLGNTASGTRASISGGVGNIASGRQASISGGRSNNASGSEASISGGNGNAASGSTASVSGGGNNIASNTNASVSGGASNIASGVNSSVSGGFNHSATGTNSWAAGSLLEAN